MRLNQLLLACSTAGLLTVPASAQPSAEADVSLGRVNNQYICVFNERVSAGNVRAEAHRAVNPELGQLLFVYEHAIRGFAVRLPAEQASAQAQMGRLKQNNSNIAYCEQDQIVRAVADDGDPETPWGVDRVGGPSGGGSVDMSSSNKRAWVIDSGIDLDHGDLNVDRTKEFTCVRSRAGTDDENGHGTHVAGTIAAKKGNGGVAGVAAGNRVVPVRVLDRRGSGTWSCVIAGVDHVYANGTPGDVANMSLGGGKSKAVNDAVIRASNRGIWFTVAAGNSGADASNYSPASADGTYIRTISATDSNDRMASWSNYGAPVDYAEPGVSINSTYKGGGYKVLSGTSMAAPHHAGLLLVDGTVSSCGTAAGDPDNPDDPIGCH